MKNWFKNLSINKQRLVALAIIILGSILLVVAVDNFIYLLLALPLIIIGLVLLFWIEKKHKTTKQDDSTDSTSYKIKYEMQNENQPHTENKYETFFVLPKNSEVFDYRTIETRVRGVYYNDIYDYEIELDDEVAIKHRPNSDYPESTEVVLVSDGTLLGHLMKEMAIEFVAQYGKNFCFIGKIIDFAKDRENKEMIGKIIIQFDVPRFRKIKKD